MHQAERDQLTWEVHDAVPAEAGRVVDEGIGRFNNAAAPLKDVTRLSCFARSSSGAVVGGAVGRIWGECCELQQLWVEDRYRGEGIGRRLLEIFENHAAKHGCRSFYLETFSFQAPAFYRDTGYGILAEIRGFPDGIVKYIMARSIDA